MLNNLLSLCLLTLLSSGQNYIANVTDIGVGYLGIGSDRVIHFNFSSANPFQLDYGRQEDLISLLYNEGGNFTHVRCHDLVCEDHTKTVIDQGVCGHASCPAEFCTGNPYVSTSSQTFVYSSRITSTMHAVVCNGTVCDDAVPRQIWHTSTSSVDCALDDEENIFAAVSYTTVSNMLLRCNNVCSTVARYFEGKQWAFGSRPRIGFTPNHPKRPWVVLIRPGRTELYFTTSDDNQAFCRCPYLMLLTRGVVDVPFAARMRNRFGQNWLQVSYVSSKNGVTTLNLLSCRMGAVACLEVHDNVIDTILSGNVNPSMSYGSQGNLIIGYTIRDAQQVWHIKLAHCGDFTCSQASFSDFPQGGNIGRFSMAVNKGTDDVYALFNAGSRVKLLALFRFYTSSPTRPPTLRPTRKPTGSPTVAVPTMSPIPDPTLSPTPAPTMVTDAPTHRPTGVPTEQPTESPTPCFDPNAEGIEDEGDKVCASELTLGWVVNGFFFFGNMIAFSCIFNCMARCMSYCKPSSTNHAIEDGIVSIE